MNSHVVWTCSDLDAGPPQASKVIIVSEIAQKELVPALTFHHPCIADPVDHCHLES